MIRIFYCLVIFCLTSLACADNQAKILQRIEIKQQHNQTTLLLSLQNHTQAKFFLLPNPDRLIVDLPETQASNALPKEIHSNGCINNIRLGNGPFGPGNLRLVMDLAAPVEYTNWDDQDEQKNTQRLTIFLTQKKSAAATAPTQANSKPTVDDEPASIEEIEKQPAQENHPEKITRTIAPLTLGQAHLINQPSKNYTLINQSSLKKIIIMIDPGHGGKDSGAIGPNHILEKNIVLAVSKILQHILNNTPGIDARLTRQGDYFIPLRRRLDIARYNHAQMFIAIHADACRGDEAHGASVFALSQHGASSENARWLAERENTSELSGIDLKTKNHELKSILLDMSQTATIRDSVMLGGNILSAFTTFTTLHAAQVEQAGFVVLKSPDIPSVLVETGFISTPEEEHLLNDPQYQKKLAQGIATGITHYFAANPPPNSWFEMQYTARS